MSDARLCGQVPDQHPDNGTNQFLANSDPFKKRIFFLAQKLTELGNFQHISQIFNNKYLKNGRTCLKQYPTYHECCLTSEIITLSQFSNFSNLKLKYPLPRLHSSVGGPELVKSRLRNMCTLPSRLRWNGQNGRRSRWQSMQLSVSVFFVDELNLKRTVHKKVWQKRCHFPPDQGGIEEKSDNSPQKIAK